jgi:hypothetical protein
MAGRTPNLVSADTATGSARAARRNATSHRQNLPALRNTMNSARGSVLLARLPPSDPGQLRIARVAQLLAMTQYEQALTGCRLPIPSRLLQETRLLRRLLA